jgi:hypothetical protein
MTRNQLLYVNGRWRAGSEGGGVMLVNSSNEIAVGHVTRASSDDFDDALSNVARGVSMDAVVFTIAAAKAGGTAFASSGP